MNLCQVISRVEIWIIKITERNMYSYNDFDMLVLKSNKQTGCPIFYVSLWKEEY